ncbi:MAG: hypothetical protein JW785_00915 [Acidimicrobiia bacterium]|nr:hypothetical protein [Acidimicrobiia bacterium]
MGRWLRWGYGAVAAALPTVAPTAAEPGGFGSPAPPVFGKDFRISGAAALSDEIGAAAAWNSDNNDFLVVWRDGRDRAGGRGYEIYGRHVGADGSVLGPDFRISGPAAVDDEQDPGVAHSATSRQVWTDGRAGTATDIYGRRVAAGGGC